MSDTFPDQFSEQARLDFQRARFKAFVNRVWATLSGQSTTLLSYDEIKEKLHIGGPIYRGVQTVLVEEIVGSLNRYHEFDRVFLPASDKLVVTERFRRPRFGQLEIQVTINDPTYYTQPWTATTNAQLRLDTELFEFICAENERSSKHMGPGITPKP